MFERDDIQDGSQEVLLESQSWRGPQRLSHAQAGRTPPFSSRQAVGTFSANAINSTDQRETCPQIPEAPLTLGFLPGPGADGQTTGWSWGQMPSAQGRWRGQPMAFPLWPWILPSC